MSGIETVIIILLVLMVVPELCARVGRRGLAYPVFVLLGIALGPLFPPDVRTMLQEIGKVGFLLLLFEVGLDVDLPGFRDLLRALRFVVPYGLVQYLLIAGVAVAAGVDLGAGVVTAAALAACSVGMAYPAWRTFAAIGENRARHILHAMILLEVVSILVLAVASSVAAAGWGWRAAVDLGAVVLVVVLTGRSVPHVTRLFQRVLERTTHWRVHLLVVVVLAVAALGERSGLSAAKTAFFLGLFMARVEHDGQGLEDYLAPITKRLLIPVCFVALGLQIPWALLLAPIAALAAGSAAGLLLVRAALYRVGLRVDEHPRAFLLLSPNLTIVALAATTLLAAPATVAIGSWLLLTGLFVSVPALVLLPRSEVQPAAGAVKAG